MEAEIGQASQHPQLRRVRAVRYVMPLREGGSLPAIVEGDDLGLYVLKFRGAGQGPLALVAELVAGGIGQALGLLIPELVLMEVLPELGRNEPDAEIRALLKESIGWNVGMDFLPGARMFDPAAGDHAEPREASLLVWFDALLSNVDRTPRNPNLLLWHKRLRPIDHGAALFWQHDWESRARGVRSPFPASRGHVLLPWATALRQAELFGRKRLNRELFAAIVAQVPGDWLLAGRPEQLASEPDLAERRAAYVSFLDQRLEQSSIFTGEAERGHAERT